MINFPRSQVSIEGTYSKKIFLFVIVFNPNLPNINYIIREHLLLLESDTKSKELFPKNSIIQAYRRSKPLREILAPSKYNSRITHNTNPLERGCYKCDKSRCDLCKNYFVESKTFCSFKTINSYIVIPNLTCSSKTSSIWFLARNVSFNMSAQQPQNSK